MRQQQRGSVELIVIAVLALILIGGGTTAVLVWKQAIVRAEQAENEKNQWKEDSEAKAQLITDMLLQKKRRDEAEAKREKERSKKDEKARAQDAKAEQAAANDPAVRAWRDERVPQSLVDSMRDDRPSGEAGKAGTVPAPGKPAAGKATPSVPAKPDQR